MNCKSVVHYTGSLLDSRIDVDVCGWTRALSTVCCTHVHNIEKENHMPTVPILVLDSTIFLYRY